MVRSRCELSLSFWPSKKVVSLDSNHQDWESVCIVLAHFMVGSTLSIQHMFMTAPFFHMITQYFYNALPYFTYPITIDKLDNGENSLHVDHFLKSWLFHAFFHPDVTCRAKAYLLTFLACLAFGVRQLRIFQKVDMQNSTPKAALSRAGLVMAWCCAAKIRVFFFEG